MVATGLLAGGCLSNEPELGSNQDDAEAFEAFRDGLQQEGGGYIVEGDMVFEDEDALRGYWEANYQNGALTINRYWFWGWKDDGWSSSDRQNLTWCVDNSFGFNTVQIVKAMDVASAEWEARGNVNFVHATAQDGAGCTSGNGNVKFNVTQVEVGGEYAARAFFPSTSRSGRILKVNRPSLNQPMAGLAGLIGHELGHALGFRHEHVRPESGGLCSEDSNWRGLTPYDSDSIMSYFGDCGGTAPSFPDNWWSPLDRQGIASFYGAGFRGFADIMWKQTSTNALSIWFMASNGQPSSFGNRAITAGWDIVGTGDFNGDFKGDILQRHTNGTFSVWLWNGTFGYLNGWDLSGVPAGSTFLGTGDVDGDRRTELIFRNGSQAQLVFLGGDGFVVDNILTPLIRTPPANNLQPINAPTGRALLGTGDFDRSGQADLLWGPRTDIAGQPNDVVIWLMKSQEVKAVMTIADTNGGAFAGIGDFDGEGTDDIFRINPTTRQLQMWFMRGGQRISTGFPASSDPNWTFQSVGDFNGDWKADLLWRHWGGTLGIWFMDGTTHTGDGFPGFVDNDWVVRGTPRFD